MLAGRARVPTRVWRASGRWPSAQERSQQERRVCKRSHYSLDACDRHKMATNKMNEGKKEQSYESNNKISVGETGAANGGVHECAGRQCLSLVSPGNEPNLPCFRPASQRRVWCASLWWWWWCGGVVVLVWVPRGGSHECAADTSKARRPSCNDDG